MDGCGGLAGRLSPALPLSHGRQHRFARHRTRSSAPTFWAAGIWVGVALRTPTGKHGGLVAGHRYFTCKPKHGVFVRPARLFDDYLCTATSTSFLDQCTRISQLHTAPNAKCDVLYLVPVLIGCGLVLAIRCYAQFIPSGPGDGTVVPKRTAPPPDAKLVLPTVPYKPTKRSGKAAAIQRRYNDRDINLHHFLCISQRCITPTRTMWYAPLRAHAYWMLIGACNVMAASSVQASHPGQARAERPRRWQTERTSLLH